MNDSTVSVASHTSPALPTDPATCSTPRPAENPTAQGAEGPTEAPAAGPAPDAPDVRAALQAVRWEADAAAIERESFRRIEAACGPPIFPPGEWRVARRLVHATGDPSVIQGLAFRHDPIRAGLGALRRGAPIFCDSSMIRAGLSVDRLRSVHAGYSRERLLCHIADADVAARARAERRTRALCAVEKARPWLEGSVILVGNAPLALARVARYCLEEGLRPALVIGMPVGFVNVTESKALLALCPVPQIVLEGRRGGSALAVAALHAVLESGVAPASAR